MRPPAGGRKLTDEGMPVQLGTRACNAALNMLLAISLVFFSTFGFIAAAVFLENTPEAYARYYEATQAAQPLIVASWLVSLGVSPVLLAAIPARFGRQVLRSRQWRLSLGLILAAGVPSLVLVGIGFWMRHI